MTTLLQHSSLEATLRCVQYSHNNSLVNQYRGIPYAHIPGRFQISKPLDSWNDEELDCTRFGPICPQNYADVSYLLRIPESLGQQVPHFNQDEFNCLNINVTTPAPEVTSTRNPLPVLLWIHGGSQVVSFPPPDHPVSDPSTTVAQAAALGKPLVLVTFNYRLNIFGFGDGTQQNLALKDQRLAISWVSKHIASFGGDEDNITLCGQSASAVYVHAHLCTSASVKRGILQSGSLYLSPPQPFARGARFTENLSQHLYERTGCSLKDAPVAELLHQLREDNINTLFLLEESDLKDWKMRLADVPELMIGDVEFESIIWRSGIEHLTAYEISTSFTNPVDPHSSKALLQAYQISPKMDTVSQIGALDFLTDLRFAYPAPEIARARKSIAKPGVKTFRYVFDQPSPFQPSSRAHHGVDLLYLFGAYSDTFWTVGQRKVGHIMREKWITFANGEAPWSELSAFAFGPYGRCGEITDIEYGERRRVKVWENFTRTDPAELDRVFVSLAGGRISLLN